jgi:hypothetical protein
MVIAVPPIAIESEPANIPPQFVERRPRPRRVAVTANSTVEKGSISPLDAHPTLRKCSRHRTIQVRDETERVICEIPLDE